MSKNSALRHTAGTIDVESMVWRTVTDIGQMSSLPDWREKIDTLSSRTETRVIEPVYVVISDDGKRFIAKANVHVVFNFVPAPDASRRDPIVLSDTIPAVFTGTIDDDNHILVERALFQTEDFDVLSKAH
ncbi:hypothetical protein [Zavarzinia sp.]|uniref:hypothetical protein n=1 Tax=Zavarzinia sp. TaxID=2027920 RepID=UPI003BB6EE3B